MNHDTQNNLQTADRWYPHLTVASIAKHNGRYLLVKEAHRGTSVINQPAGHVEQGETLIDAVIRETLEETAWEFEPKFISGIYQFIASNGETYMRFTFSGNLIKPVADSEIDPTIEEVVWMDKTQLENSQIPLRSQAVLKCVEDYEAGNQFPLNLIQQLKSPS